MIFPYIVNVAIILGACLAFYKLLLRRETFYRVNRYVLVICILASFALPLIKTPSQFSLRTTSTSDARVSTQQAVAFDKHNEQAKANNTQMEELVKSIQQRVVAKSAKSDSLARNAASRNSGVTGMTNPKPLPSQPVVRKTETPESHFSWNLFVKILFGIYWFGVAVLGISFLLQLISLFVRMYRYPVIIDGQYRIVEITGDKAPCSFGNTIFINPEKYEWDTYSQILAHEKVHIRQKHSFDIVLSELVLIFQWFNPFAWLYRREVESNLEFLTDDQVIQQKVDKKTYQLSLVRVAAPHFPLSLTTNYNQSILKKRIAMMNSKQSNLHTAWKYFFLMPLFVFLICLLNEPSAKSQTKDSQSKSQGNSSDETEGSWFAVIKGDKVSIQFRRDDELNNQNFNSNSYKVSDFSPALKDGVTAFTLTRDAGTLDFTGKFENSTGMGHYKFAANKSFNEYLDGELKEKVDEQDMLVFFFVDVKKDFIPMLKKQGFKDITKDDIIPVAALGIDQNYITSMKSAGYKDVTLENLVSMKALGIDGKYVEEIRGAGYKDISTDELVSFKAQGIDKDYINKVHQLRGKNTDGKDDAEDMISFKAMNVSEEMINSFKAIGYNDMSNEELVSFKSVGVTPEYVKSWEDQGFKKLEPEELIALKAQNIAPQDLKGYTEVGCKDLQPNDLVSMKAVGVTPEYVKGWRALGYKDFGAEQFIGMKSQNITPEYMKTFTDIGYKDIDPESLVAFHALGITPEWIHSFEAIGYKNIDKDELPALKSQNITPDFIKGFEEVGFKNISIDEIVSVKAMGITPDYIKTMKAKGFNYTSLEKYITLKSLD